MEGAAFLAAMMCAYQVGNGSACNAAASAFFVAAQGQQVLDKANKQYLDTLPVEVKKAGAVVGFYYSQSLRVTLYKGLTASMSFHRDDKLNETFVSNNIGYSISFP